MPKIFHSPKELLSAVGQELGHSDWLEMTQERIQLFADATGDHQWIHVDEERARQGPFGACIAHGYLTLSMLSLFLPQIVQVEGIKMGINYGLDRVRFPAPVRVGAQVRGSAFLLRAEELPQAIQTVVRITVEIRDEPKPACVAESLSRYIPA